MPEDSKQFKSYKKFPVITNRKLQTDREECRQKTEHRIIRQLILQISYLEWIVINIFSHDAVMWVGR